MGRHGACSATGRKDLDSPDGPGHSHSDCVGLTFSKPATCEDAASIYNGISSGLWMPLDRSADRLLRHELHPQVFGLACASITVEPFLLISACGLRWAPSLAFMCVETWLFLA